MAYFDKIKTFVITRGVASNILAIYLAKFLISKVIAEKEYKKDYLQIIEFSKEEDILKVSIRQEEVNEEIKENKIEFEIKNINKILLKKFDIKKMYLIEDEEYEGQSIQTLLLPEEY